MEEDVFEEVNNLSILFSFFAPSIFSFLLMLRFSDKYFGEICFFSVTASRKFPFLSSSLFHFTQGQLFVGLVRWGTGYNFLLLFWGTYWFYHSFCLFSLPARPVNLVSISVGSFLHNSLTNYLEHGRPFSKAPKQDRSFLCIKDFSNCEREKIPG